MSKLYRKDDPSSLQGMFSNIAERYDTGNAALSFQLFRLWNRRLIKEQLLTPPYPRNLLDLCCGTGAIGFHYLHQLRKRGEDLTKYHVTFVDFSEKMLEEAQKKAKEWDFPEISMQFLCGDAHDLPFKERRFDATVIAYGIRNVVHPQRCLKEVFRVLSPNGRLAILELTRPKSRILQLGHALYIRTLVPLIGKWITSDKQAYQYLCQSIENFVAPDELQQICELAGFSDSTYKPLTGGIATLFTAQKI